MAAFLAGAPLHLARAADVPSPEVVKIWPGSPPGTEAWSGPEQSRLVPRPGQAAIEVVSNVTVPTLTVYRPSKETANGAAMIIAPGGGFRILAVDHEGEMVARWLAGRGYTAFVLKYRVRADGELRIPPDMRRRPEQWAALMASLAPGRRIAVADGVQAIRHVRANAARYGVAPDRIGFMGFSAGAITTMGVVMDTAPADRPNFAAPIYGAMEAKPPPHGAPPLFIVATQEDEVVPAGESLKIFSAWSAAGAPAELHVFERGAHGFGMLPTGSPVDSWPKAFEAWLLTHARIAEAPQR